MNLFFDNKICLKYKSASQVARIVTEYWLAQNMFCPICGAPLLHQYTANKPVADFYCDLCKSDFELKSYKSNEGKIKHKITDGAFCTMMERITSLKNPHLFVMSYANMEINNLLLIPKFFFTPNIIEKRQPLKETARRAGWIGCNIEIGNIPEIGKIYIIKNKEEINKADVIQQYQQVLKLQTSAIEKRGWMFDIIQCIERVPNINFCLNDIYAFSEELQIKHPENNFVKDKIRQQLQYLRDKGFIEFTTRGHYKKIHL